MRLSTSTNFFGIRLDGTFTPFIEAIRRCDAAGYKVIDVNFCSAIRGLNELTKDNWQENMYELKNEAEKLGVEFTQSHPVFSSGELKEHPIEYQENYKEMMKRSIIGSSILGVKWAILHPAEDISTPVFDLEANIKKNREYFDPFVELAIKYNVGVAFENMIEKADVRRRFSSKADELVALIDSYNHPLVGACWDFGHGNFIHKDQTVELRKLGKRLKALHVDDNHGTADDHVFPFHGNIDWYSIMPVLTEIGYEGDFTYEAQGEFNKLPEHIKDSIAKVGYEIGMYCLSLA